MTDWQERPCGDVSHGRFLITDGAMQQALPELIIIPTYDPFAYTRELVQPFLVDGALSANEWSALRETQASLVDESGKLRGGGAVAMGEDGRGMWAGLGGDSVIDA